MGEPMQTVQPIMGLGARLPTDRAVRPREFGGEDALLESNSIPGREVGPTVADRIEKVALLLRSPEYIVGKVVIKPLGNNICFHSVIAW